MVSAKKPGGQKMSYIGSKMSERAYQAYENGEKPLSKWTKSEILSRFFEKMEENGEELSENEKELLKALSLKTLKNELLEKSSWHHTGSFYNCTDFYDAIDEKPNLDVLIENDREERETEREEKKTKSKENYCIITYFWSENLGSKKHPKIYDFQENFLATVKGETASLPSGKKVRKFKILHTFCGKPRKNSKELKMLENSYKKEKRNYYRF